MVPSDLSQLHGHSLINAAQTHDDNSGVLFVYMLPLQILVKRTLQIERLVMGIITIFFIKHTAVTCAIMRE